MKLQKRLSVVIASVLAVGSIYSPIFANDNNVNAEVNNVQAVTVTNSEVTTSASLCPTKNIFPNTKLLEGKKLVVKATGATLVDYSGNIYNAQGRLIAKSDGSFVAETGEVLIDGQGNILDENGKVAIYANGEVNKETACIRYYTDDDTCKWEVDTKGGVYGRVQLRYWNNENVWRIRDKAEKFYEIQEYYDDYGVLTYNVWIDDDTVMAVRPSENSSNIIFKSVGDKGFYTKGNNVWYDEATMKNIEQSSSSSGSTSGSSSSSSSSNSSSSNSSSSNSSSSSSNSSSSSSSNSSSSSSSSTSSNSTKDTSKEKVADKKNEAEQQKETQKEPQEETVKSEPQKEASNEISKETNETTKKVIKDTNSRVLKNSAKKVDFKVIINGNPTDLKDDILEENGRTMLPLRSIANALNVQIEYNAEDKVAIIEKDGLRIEFPLGYNVAIVNGKEIQIDSSDKEVRSIVSNGRTYLPVRFIAEQLGLEIGFNDGTISINNK